MITLPFPPSSLSGHNTGHHYVKAPIVARHREWARLAALEAKPSIPAEGDIRVHVHFVPPDRRGDRCNFWNRVKPYLDGIAQALGINDKRFLPSKSFGEPEKPGRVEVTFPPLIDGRLPCDGDSGAVENERAGLRQQPRTGPDQSLPDKEAM